METDEQPPHGEKTMQTAVPAAVEDVKTSPESDGAKQEVRQEAKSAQLPLTPEACLLEVRVRV